MKIIVRDPAIVEKAAKSVGVLWLETSQPHKRRDGRYEVCGVLRPIGERFRRRGLYRKRIAAVCCHGHYHFIKTLLSLDPTARVSTALVRAVGGKGERWMDRENFETIANKIRYVNIGSIINPLYFFDACYCD